MKTVYPSVPLELYVETSGRLTKTKTLTVQGIGIGVLPTQVAKPLVELKQLRALAIPKVKNLFGLHNIGLLAGAPLLKNHRDFAQDIYRLGQHWTKS